MILHMFALILVCALFFTALAFILDGAGAGFLSLISVVFWLTMSPLSFSLSFPMYNGTAIEYIDTSTGWLGFVWIMPALVMMIYGIENIARLRTER